MAARALIQAIPISGIPEVRPGDSVASLIRAALRKSRLRLLAGDILVVKHKVISKAEGAVARLDGVNPRPKARRWAEKWGRDARVIELATQNARGVIRMKNGVLITETRHGVVCANSGVDLSNVDGGTSAVLLPTDPDGSARRLMAAVRRARGLRIPVIIADSFGRPWREGLTEAAIGVAGLEPLRDFRGQVDPHGYELHASAEAVADELAALAGLACGKLERIPACIIRGFRYQPGRGGAHKLIRPAEKDLFR
ncbi:MAG: coenzyme F420-0:L-glutamate ligase [Acidobacteria bacterium]|nr:coenzyme F420-0:L-glutamate ligase [Acidobacteriota bacterium]